MKKKIKIVYLLSASHSGSTLTAMLLGAHPDLCTVGELGASGFGDTNAYMCSCHKRITECEFWRNISNEMKTLGIRFDIFNPGTNFFKNTSMYVRFLLKPLCRGKLLEIVRDTLLSFSAAWRKSYKDVQERNVSYASAIEKITGAYAIIDSSKLGLRLKYLLKNKKLDIYVIWLVRDGRGVSLAYKQPGIYADAKNPSLRGGGSGTTNEKSRDITLGAREWVRCNEEAMAVLKRVKKDKQIKIHYEDICCRTDETLNKIYNFIGVDPDLKVKEFKSVEHHVVGNGMRLDDSSEIILDERWRTDLAKNDLDDFERVAGKMNRLLGYR